MIAWIHDSSSTSNNRCERALAERLPDAMNDYEVLMPEALLALGIPPLPVHSYTRLTAVSAENASWRVLRSNFPRSVR